MQRTYPVRADERDERDHLAAPPPQHLTLPPSVDWSAWLGPVKDQGELGACTGFAWAGMREFLYRRFAKLEVQPILGEPPVFSPLFLYYEERALDGTVLQDAGANSRDGAKVLASTGVCLESEDVYAPTNYKVAPTPTMVAEAQQFKIGAYHRVLDLPTLKSVLASGYCACMGIQVFSSMETDAVAVTGVVPMPNPGERCLGGHEVLAYGYDDARGAVLVRNSWGSGWGRSGNFLLPYAYFDSNVMDMWTAHLGKPW